MIMTFVLFVPEENIWRQDSDIDKSLPSWGNESVLDEHYEDLHVHNNDEVSDGLILEPHKVLLILYCFSNC